MKILAGAKHSIGGGAVDAVETIRAQAVVQGPRGQFVTVVWSARDGRARMEQSGGFVAATHPSGAWRLDARTGEAVELDPEILSMVRGHEVHMVMMAPLTRYVKPKAAGEVEFGEKKALAVEFSDSFDDRVLAYYAVADTAPLGLRLTHPDPDVFVTFDDWTLVEGVRLFGKAEFTQGAESFQYRFTDLELNAVDDSVFVDHSSRLQTRARKP